MWLSPKFGRIARYGAGGLLALGVYGGAVGIREYLKIDPFLSLRARSTQGIGDDVLMQFRDVDVRQFKAGKLVTSANVDRLEMNKDRMNFTLFNVKQGEYAGEQGKTRFTADRAEWNSALKRLIITDNAKVSGRDYALAADRAILDGTQRTLRIPTTMTGQIKGGNTRVSNFQMNLDTQAMSSGPVNWRGRLPEVQDSPVPAQDRTPWDISADGTEDSGKESKTSTYKVATATDGEILIKAPTVDLDRRTDVLTATGRVFYYSAKVNMVADKVVVYRREKRAVFTGNVLMLAKPKEENVEYKPQEEELPPFRPIVPDSVSGGRPEAPVNGPSEEEKAWDKKLRDGESVHDFPTVITSQNIEYFYKKGSRRATITGNPQARQELPGGRWRNVWSFQAFYDGEEETLKGTSREGEYDAILKNSIGDALRAKSILLHTAEGDERYSAQNIKGRVWSDPDEDDPRDKAKKNPPPTASAKPVGPSVKG